VDIARRRVDTIVKYIKVDNFKSLVDFELPLAKFSCLVGLNSAGKSTILQFFDFLSQQFRGDLNGWLKKRQWEASDLNSKLNRKQNISFEISLSQVSYDINAGFKEVEIKWLASFNRYIVVTVWLEKANGSRAIW
jgi:predicted ATPase